jgi:hypothetical protein
MILLATASSRGVAWDEPDQAEYGRAVISWYSSGFHDRSAVEENQWNLFLYGGAVEAPIEAVVGVVGADPYLVRHLLLALGTLAGLLGTYLLGAALGGKHMGFLATVLLATTPRFFAHGSFNSKDIPFAVLYVWSLYLLTRDLDRKTGSSLWQVVPLGLLTGLLMGIRVAGAIIFVPFVVGYTARWWTSERNFQAFASLGARFSFVVLIAWVVMLIAWPWAQMAPLLNPMAALVASSEFLPDFQELFRGQFVTVRELPLSYLPVWLLRTLPEATLLGLAFCVLLLLLGETRRRRPLGPALIATITAIGFPLTWLALTRVNLYDGPRHLFFIQPLLALAAAAGIVGVSSRIRRGFKMVLFGMIGSAVLVTLGDAIRLYPLEHVFFNRVSGGLPSAAGKYELDYWGLSYREGAEWLNQNVGIREGTSVASCSRPESTEHFLSDEFEFLGSLAYGVVGQPDYLLYTAAHDCGDRKPSGEVIHEVKRSGVPLLTITRLTSGDPTDGEADPRSHAPEP